MRVAPEINGTRMHNLKSTSIPWIWLCLLDAGPKVLRPRIHRTWSRAFRSGLGRDRKSPGSEPQPGLLWMMTSQVGFAPAQQQQEQQQRQQRSNKNNSNDKVEQRLGLWCDSNWASLRPAPLPHPTLPGPLRLKQAQLGSKLRLHRLVENFAEL